MFKKCSGCGRVFETVRDFVNGTTFVCYRDVADLSLRNCKSCDSTLSVPVEVIDSTFDKRQIGKLGKKLRERMLTIGG